MFHNASHLPVAKGLQCVDQESTPIHQSSKGCQEEDRPDQEHVAKQSKIYLPILAAVASNLAVGSGIYRSSE